jgi:uncharacterized BrkB/YihY/UPF0761 family membrane protein
LLIQSTIAFSTTKQAMEAIFGQTERTRPWYVSLTLPFVYVLFLVLILSSVTAVLALVNTAVEGALMGWLAYIGSVLGQGLLFTAYYRFMPPVSVSLKRAVVSGFAVAMSWELLRALVSAYFRHVSAVGLLYGSLSAPLVVLFGIEVLAIIILIGAQTLALMAEYDASKASA